MRSLIRRQHSKFHLGAILCVFIQGGPKVDATSTESHLCRENGSEILEFALVFAALMTLMMGIVVFARAYNVYQTINRATREGARMAVLPASVNQGNTYIDGSSGSMSDPIFQNYIVPALIASSVDPLKVTNYTETVEWLNPGDTDKQCGVVISFQYPYTISIPFLSQSLDTINLSVNVRMRRENQSVTTTTVGGVTSTSLTCP